MNFLGFDEANIVIFGMANRKSVAYAVSQVLADAGANLLYVVRDDQVRAQTQKLLGDAPVICCDVEDEAAIAALPDQLPAEFRADGIDGIVHSIAFANYSDGFGAFHETGKRDFLQAMDISCFSLVEIANCFQPFLTPRASIVTISISSTRMAAENYGYMGPIKAALDSSVVFLAKSLGSGTEIRVNAVGAGLLKTSSSAGIPGYVDSYLYAEKVIPRGRNLETREVADTVAFLLSERASGITGQTLIVDAGMSISYFDRAIVRRVTAPDQ